MKKLIGIIIMTIVIGTLAACGAGSSLTGTWSAESADVNGSNYTIAELEALGDSTISDLYIILKDGGSAYVYSAGQGAVVAWEKSATGVTIGVQDCNIADDKILLEYNGATIYLSKTSDSQVIPEE